MYRIKYCREIAFKLLYQVDILGNDAEGLNAEALLEKNADFFKGLNRKEKDYIIQIIEKSTKEQETIDQLISTNLIGWKLDRLMPVDRSLLRVGISESFFNHRKAVIIDDIIRIAKKYAGSESYKIINAVLDKALK